MPGVTPAWFLSPYCHTTLLVLGSTTITRSLASSVAMTSPLGSGSASDGLSRVSAPVGRYLSVSDLRAEFGESPLRSPAGSRVVLDAAGRMLLSQLAAVVEHRWSKGIQRGVVRGFRISGPPGTGDHDGQCDEIFIGQGVSGKLARRPELEAALARLRPGDTLVITRLSRAVRSLRHLLELAAELACAGYVPKPHPRAS